MTTFARRPETLARGVLRARPACNDEPPYKFGYARTALKFGLQELGLVRGDGLLVPEFICESAIEPLVPLGITPQYYPVNEALEPDWQKIAELLTSSTKAVLAVHYFGNPQRLDLFQDFCRRHALFLVEDNAHGYGAVCQGRLVGTIGDIGVTAPRKAFGLPHGAYLHAKTGIVLVPELQLRRTRTGFKQSVKHWAEKVRPLAVAIESRRRTGARKRREGPPPEYGSQAAFRDPPLAADYAMDAGVHTYLQCVDMAQVRERRQALYRLWEQWSIGQGLAPVFERLEEGAMPLVFPALTDSAAQSQRWFERGHRAGIDIHSWPTLPECIVQKNTGAMRLWERLVCFPIHQEMDVELLQLRLADL